MNMKKPNNGGSAFPRKDLYVTNGITQRDYFAAAAIPALIAATAQNDDYNPMNFFIALESGVGAKLPNSKDETYAENIAWMAYGIADAMLFEKEINRDEQ